MSRYPLVGVVVVVLFEHLGNFWSRSGLSINSVSIFCAGYSARSFDSEPLCLLSFIEWTGVLYSWLLTLSHQSLAHFSQSDLTFCLQSLYVLLCFSVQFCLFLSYCCCLFRNRLLFQAQIGRPVVGGSLRRESLLH